MARSDVAPRPRSHGQEDSQLRAKSDASRRPKLKVWLFGAVILSLALIVSFALGREVGTSSSGPSMPVRPALATPRPALSAAEEAYARALWPIHNDVKASALRMTLAGIQYKTQNLEAPTLKARVEAILETYRRAESQLLTLQPPPSMQPFHDEYLEAVRLYGQSAVEMMKVADDGRDDHLVAAFPMSQQGGLKLRRVGDALWPGEYVPN